jgi:hypothetical protein
MARLQAPAYILHKLAVRLCIAGILVGGEQSRPAL